MLTEDGVLIGRVLIRYPFSSSSLPSFSQLPSWTAYAAAGASVALLTLLALALPTKQLPHINVAFIGNSMQYYNDLPRLLETLANGKMTQNSCLHGGASLSTILVWGNGMGSKWKTGTARLGSDETTGAAVYDFGACTVPQLLFGYDAALNERDAAFHNSNNNKDEQENGDDAMMDDGNMKNLYNSEADDFYSYNDGSNPCLLDENYLPYLQSVYYAPEDVLQQHTTFDFVVMNDNTRSPARNDTRYEALQVLVSTYVPWFLEMGPNTIPVFIRYALYIGSLFVALFLVLAAHVFPVLLHLHVSHTYPTTCDSTYGYWTQYRDMGGLEDIPTFTSFTHHGYLQYAALLADALPREQAPRIAPVGLAFLMVWEEKYHVWQKLFHVDWIHPSPSGTFLQALVIYHTLYGVLPEQSVALRSDTANLWYNARRFQPREHRRLPFPTLDEAKYLYNVAVRICVYQRQPQSLILYNNDNTNDNDEDEDTIPSAATYIPNDDLFKIDDLFR
jgi:hypothetical protein